MAAGHVLAVEEAAIAVARFTWHEAKRSRPRVVAPDAPGLDNFEGLGPRAA